MTIHAYIVWHSSNSRILISWWRCGICYGCTGLYESDGPDCNECIWRSFLLMLPCFLFIEHDDPSFLFSSFQSSVWITSSVWIPSPACAIIPSSHLSVAMSIALFCRRSWSEHAVAILLTCRWPVLRTEGPLESSYLAYNVLVNKYQQIKFRTINQEKIFKNLESLAKRKKCL